MSRRPRVWFVSELFWPEETSTGYFVTRIAEDVAAQWDVRAVCSQPTYSARGVVAPRAEVRNGVRIERMRSTTLDKDVLPFRIINMLSFGAVTFLHVLRRLRRGDVLVAVTNPPLLPYLLRIAAALRGARFTLLVHDVYPEVLVATGVASPDSAHVRLLRMLSGWMYRGAERVVVLGRDMQRLVASRLPDAAAAPVIIPNWGDTETIRPDAAVRQRSRARLGLDGCFVVQYLGNMGRTHDVLTLVDAAAELADDPAFLFHFVGWGAQRPRLEAEVARRGLTNVRVDGPCSADDLPGYLNAADLAVISFRAGMAGISVPSRLYNVMAAGLPVLALADDMSEVAHIVAEEGLGWVVAPGEAELLAALLRSLAADGAALKDAGARSRNAAVRAYSRAASRQAWLDLLQDLHPTAPPLEVVA